MEPVLAYEPETLSTNHSCTHLGSGTTFQGVLQDLPSMRQIQLALKIVTAARSGYALY